ncbi:hypothetical protein VKT23_012103 [Stygiomarasmius scandens]|uniref:Uncharacterized protein n=1 Tax=Marasmiellus scandens TaxID=2682957 RepID=A0ABR1J6X9_9AGAR
MEKCTLVLDVPASNSTDTRVTIRGSDGKDSVVLDVYSLDTTQKLDFRQLSNPPCVFTTTMFHQLRCLDILRSAMNNHYHAEAVPPMPELAQHCLNYIRQTITCTGDVHISDTLCYHGHPEVREDPLICRDWTRAYEALEGNQREYFKSIQ